MQVFRTFYEPNVYKFIHIFHSQLGTSLNFVMAFFDTNN